LGLPGGDGEEESFIKALETVLEIGKRLGLHIGTVAADEAAAKRKTEMGFSFLLTGQDPNFLAAGAKASFQQCDKGRKAAKI
jgi:2-keto-3-deoxy-L-rhamnonate aldolase RhmA